MSATPLSLALASGPWWLYASIIVGLALHIGGGSVGIITGYGAVSVRKGEHLHRQLGKAFSYAMLTMSSAAFVLAIYLRERPNIAAAIFAAYLVTTAWATVRRPEGTIGAFEKIAALAIAATALVFLSWGVEATNSPKHALEGYRDIFYYVFGGIASFLAMLDLKVILRAGVSGVQRIARHLWRMCFAFFFAAGSFFLGQQKVMPIWMHGSKVLLVLGLAPLGFMLFWLIRVRIGNRFTRKATLQPAE